MQNNVFYYKYRGPLRKVLITLLFCAQLPSAHFCKGQQKTKLLRQKEVRFSFHREVQVHFQNIG